MESILHGEVPPGINEAMQALFAYLVSRDTLIELLLVVALAGIAQMLTGRQRAYISTQAAKHGGYPLLYKAWTILGTVAFPLTWLILQWLANMVANLAGWREGIMIITASLLTAWVVIRVASAFIGNAVVGKSIAGIAWTIAALNILGWLDEAIDLLNSIGITLGDTHITLLTLFKGLSSLVVLLWVSNIIAEFFESRVRTVSDFTPSVQVLFAKLFKIVLLGIALLVAMSAVGVDLTAFAVLGGAVGVGVGFGLQKIVSNLISGVILLIDSSIKPGDVIAVGETYGRVDSLGARYVSITTRDGTEYLIPNEDLITTRVENWSHSNSLLRLRLNVGVHYKSDVHKAMELCLEAADAVPRVLKDPRPVCLMQGFGDNSVDLELRYWINDPMNGRANVASEILVGIWDMFMANDIEIPYPQRDIHLRTPTWDQVRDSRIPPEPDASQ